MPVIIDNAEEHSRKFVLTVFIAIFVVLVCLGLYFFFESPEAGRIYGGSHTASSTQ